MSDNTKVSAFTRESSFPKAIALAPLPDRPLVSILISNYNYAPYLGQAIESALTQTYENFEIIICDDGSTDSSPEILKRYESLDSRIKIILQANGGQSQSLNAGFGKSAGDVICLLDADDVFLPDKLQLVVSALTAAPDSGLAVNRMVLVDKDRKRLADIPSLYDLPSGWHGGLPNCSGPRVVPGLPPTSGLSLHRSLAQAVFPLPAGLRAYSDTLIQVVAPLMTPIVAINAPLSEYRIHGANVGGVSRFTEERLRNIVLYEKEIWGAWRRYLAALCSETPSDSPLPPEKPPSVMDYAYARYRSGKNVKAAYRAIPRNYLSLLPRPLRWFWQVSVMLPGWLFRWCFNFIYGHSRTKMIARRALKALRNGVRQSSLGGLVGNGGTRQVQVKNIQLT